MSNILVITYWDFKDALIQTYTLPYIRIIKKRLRGKSLIWLITLEKDIDGMDAHMKEKISENLLSQGIKWVPYPYKHFGIMALWMWIRIIVHLIFVIVKNNVRTIHCWGTPAGAIGYFLSLITARKLIIDSFEPHAEAMVENGAWGKNSLAFRLLFWCEKRQTKRAFAVFAATEGMRQYSLKKFGHVPLNFFVKPACVDFGLFNSGKIKNQALLRELNLENKIVCVYAGKFGGIYLEKETFDFFKVAHNFYGSRFHILLLSGQSKHEINNYCLGSKLDPSIITLEFVPHHRVPDYMGLGDFAITPVKPVPTKRYCTPIKDGEYWALGLPVVIPSGISDDSQIIMDNGIGALIERLEPSSYHEAIEKIDLILQSPKSAYRQRIQDIAHQFRDFSIAEAVYSKVYSQEL